MALDVMKNLFGALLLGLLGSRCGLADVVTIPLTPNRAIEDRIRSIDGPEREIEVVIARDRSSQTKTLRVNARGAISDKDVQALVKAILVRDASFWTDGGAWAVSVRGDTDYAGIVVSMYCGDLCGGGATYTYGRSADGWKYLYRSSEWIS